MKTTVTDLPESRVRIDVAVEPEAVAKRIDRAARELAREVRIPGFRKGKVPPQLVIQRVGREAVVEQALRDSLPEWYERAILDAGVTTVGEPKLDVGELPGEGEELSFSIEVGVRPVAELGEYRGLEVGRPSTEVPDSMVEAELERLREGFASLAPVERPARAGDSVVIDYRGTVDGEPFEGSEARDFVVELGGDGLLEEFDRALTGASAGDELTVEVTFPEAGADEEDERQVGPPELAGKRATFEVTVKEVREKNLPELDDEFAAEASEFETLAELRDELRRRLAEGLEGRVEAQFREAAVDAAVANAKLEVPHELIHARAHELWERFERSLAARGIDARAYARMQGKTREELITELEADAERALRREATLAAVAEAEGIEVSDEELLAALGGSEDGSGGGGGGGSPAKLLARLREHGRDAVLRDELRLRKAAELIAKEARPIPAEQAAAREALWTPEKGESEGGGAGPEQPGRGAGEAAGTRPGELWTPGS